MDWTPILGTVTGAASALAGTWMNHRFGSHRDRQQRLSGKVEEIADLAFAIRARLLARLVAAGQGIDAKDHCIEIDRLHILVELHASKVSDDLSTFLDVAIKYDKLIDEATDVLQSCTTVEELTPEQGKNLSASSEAPVELFDAAVQFTHALRQHYGKYL